MKKMHLTSIVLLGCSCNLFISWYVQFNSFTRSYPWQFGHLKRSDVIVQDRDDTFIAATESNMTFYTTVNIMLEKKHSVSFSMTVTEMRKKEVEWCFGVPHPWKYNKLTTNLLYSYITHSRKEQDHITYFHLSKALEVI